MGQGDPIRGVDFDTPFHEKGLKELKAMVAGANPGLVKEVSQNYEAIAKELAGEHGILQQLEKAVNKVLETWHGKSADRFRKRAVEISQNISEGAAEVQNASQAMGAVAGALQAAVDAVSAVEEPDLIDRGLDFAGDTLSSPGGAAAALAGGMPGGSALVYGGARMLGVDVGRSDEALNRQLASGVSTRQALENNSGSLSAGKEAALQAAIPMESLAATYKMQSKTLKEGPRGGLHEKPPAYPGGPENPNVGSIGPVPSGMPSGGAAGSYKPTSPGGISMPSSDIAGPRTPGIGGGSGSQIGTGLSGFNSGTGGIGSGGGVGGGLGAGGLGGGVGAGGAGSGSGATGVPGMPGGMAAGGAAGAGSRSGARPGMPGAAGAGAAGAGGAKGAGRGGSLARQRGGIVGAAKGAGTGAQGGSGLHRSRGGSQAGKPGSGRGMAGAPGAHGAAGNKDDRRGERPDYLVEEEETWTPQRNVAPRVIE